MGLTRSECALKIVRLTHTLWLHVVWPAFRPVSLLRLGHLRRQHHVHRRVNVRHDLRAWLHLRRLCLRRYAWALVCKQQSSHSLADRKCSRDLLASIANDVRIVTVASATPTTQCLGTQVGRYAASSADLTTLGGCNPNCQSGPSSSTTNCGTSLGVPTYCCYKPLFYWTASQSLANPKAGVTAYPYISVPVTVRCAPRCHCLHAHMCMQCAVANIRCPACAL